jgi:hypothetical protein
MADGHSVRLGVLSLLGLMTICLCKIMIFAVSVYLVRNL